MAGKVCQEQEHEIEGQEAAQRGRIRVVDSVGKLARASQGPADERR
jgi:hypothetical protein